MAITSMHMESGAVVDAVARYLKIERKPRAVRAKKADDPGAAKPRPVLAKKADDAAEAKSQPVLAKKADDPGAAKPRRARRAPSAKAAAKKPSARPRAEGRSLRPRKRPATVAVKVAVPVPAKSTCPDCDGPIELSWDQCPHCALFLNPGA